MALYLKTPMGNLVSYTGLQPRVLGADVVWNNSLTETLPGARQAATYLQVMLARLVALGSITGNVVDDLSAPMVLEAVPQVFNPVTAGVSTPALVILGAGFASATLGLIHIEDWPGSGLDSNGLSLTATFVSPTQLTGVFASVGDGDPFTDATTSTAMAVVVYYEDSGSNQSNALPGNVDTHSVVTMTA